MKAFNRIPLALACVVLAIVESGCGRPGGPSLPASTSGFSGADATGVVARVEGHAISLEKFRKVLLRRSSGASKGAILEEMIQEQALVAKAKAAGYDRDPELVAAFERMIASRFEEEQFAKRLGGTARPSDVEIEEAYRRDLANYTSPASARAGVIFIAVSSKAAPETQAELKERAEMILAQANRTNPAGYAELARQHSDDQATRYKGGDSGWVNRNEPTSHWERPVIEAILSLTQPGEVAPLVTTERGFYVVRLTEAKAPSVRPLAQVKDGIRYRLAQAKEAQLRAQFYDEAKHGAHIEINQAAVDSLPEPKARSADQPPQMPGG